MKSKTASTVEDLYRVPEHGKAELVSGELVIMSPAGGLHGFAAMRITFSLHAHVERTGTGHALPDNVGFLVDLPQRKSFSPDAAYYIGPLTMKFLEGAPLLAVEVRSENDYGDLAERQMAEKRADYFAAGTQTVWDVDLLGEDTVRVYRADSPEQPTIYRRGQTAEAEPAVPGWTMPVDALFPEPDRA